MRSTEHLEDALKPLGTNDIPNANKLGIVRGNAYGKVAFINLEDQISLVFTLDGASLDRLDASSPMMGIDDGIADLERHVASTPSAEGHLTTFNGVDKMPITLNMQVSAQFPARANTVHLAWLGPGEARDADDVQSSLPRGAPC